MRLWSTFPEALLSPRALSSNNDATYESLFSQRSKGETLLKVGTIRFTGGREEDGRRRKEGGGWREEGSLCLQIHKYVVYEKPCNIDSYIVSQSIGPMISS